MGGISAWAIPRTKLMTTVELGQSATFQRTAAARSHGIPDLSPSRNTSRLPGNETYTYQKRLYRSDFQPETALTCHQAQYHSSLFAEFFDGKPVTGFLRDNAPYEITSGKLYQIRLILAAPVPGFLIGCHIKRITDQAINFELLQCESAKEAYSWKMITRSEIIFYNPAELCLLRFHVMSFESMKQCSWQSQSARISPRSGPNHRFESFLNLFHQS
jgi:hypothetical protein